MHSADYSGVLVAVFPLIGGFGGFGICGKYNSDSDSSGYSDGGGGEGAGECVFEVADSDDEYDQVHVDDDVTSQVGLVLLIAQLYR